MAGRYRIVRAIGLGGMGEVFEAEDLVVGARVALKALREDRVAAQAIERLRRELALARKITHENVCRIHDLGDHQGRVFITMELLEGETLAARIVRGALPLPEALAIADELVAGLAAIHRAGVVHRDIKSANIMLAKGRTVIMDLGVARSDALDHAHLTGEAGVIGTPAYMAPEQVEGKPATVASDIYALGVVLFEMVTGVRPFRGDSPLATASLRLTAQPLDPSTLRPELPAAWTATITRCLARAPADRFARVEDVATALRARPRRSRHAAWLGVTALAVAGAAVIGYAIGGERTPTLVATTPSKLTFQPLTFRRGTVETARFAPDGTTVLYSAAWDGQPDVIYQAWPGQPEARALFPPGTALFGVAPDGKLALRRDARRLGWLWAATQRGTLAESTLAGSEPRVLEQGVRAAEWFRGGWATLRGDGVYVAGQLWLSSAGRVAALRASPDGTKLAVATWINGFTSLVIVERPGAPRVLVPDWRVLEGFAWTPDSREIWFTGTRRGARANTLYATDLHGRVREVYRAPATLVVHDIARDGRVLLARDEVSREAAIRRAGTAADEVLSWFDDTFVVGISDNGETIGFMEGGAAGPDDGIGTTSFVRRAGRPPVKLIDSFMLGLSGDGAHALVFDPMSLDRYGTSPTGPADEKLLVVSTDPVKTTPLPQGPIRVYNTAAFSSDGRRVVAMGRLDRTAPPRLYLQELDGEPRAITPPDTEFPDTARPLSPDGTWVITGAEDIYPVAGGAARKLPGRQIGDVATRWAPDGRVYVQRSSGSSTSIFLVDLDSGTWEQQYTIAPADPAGVEIPPRAVLTPDGKTAAYSYRRRLSQLYLVSGLR